MTFLAKEPRFQKTICVKTRCTKQLKVELFLSMMGWGFGTQFTQLNPNLWEPILRPWYKNHCYNQTPVPLYPCTPSTTCTYKWILFFPTMNNIWPGFSVPVACTCSSTWIVSTGSSVFTKSPWCARHCPGSRDTGMNHTSPCLKRNVTHMRFDEMIRWLQKHQLPIPVPFFFSCKSYLSSL